MTAAPRRRAWTVEPATPADEASIRRLLREQPLGGAVRLSLEREPDWRLAAGIEGERHHAVVVRDARGGVLGLACRSVQRVWLDGRTTMLGYLGLMRRDPALPVRIGLLRRAFAALDATRRADECAFDLTAIVSDNTPARQLLERGLPGLPTYRPWRTLVTRLIPVRAVSRRWPSGIVRGSERCLPAIAGCLDAHRRGFRLAPAPTLEDLRSAVRSRGLRPEDFVYAADGGHVLGALACWDQRGMKQAVVRGYSPWLTRLRPWLNAAAWIARRPTLPAVGAAVSLAYASHQATLADKASMLLDLVRAAAWVARERGVDWLAVGLTEDSPLLPALRRALPGREYRSDLYLVHGAPGAAAAAALQHGPAHVEVATL